VYDVRLLSVAENFLLVVLVVLIASRLVALRFAVFAGLLVAYGAEFAAQGRWIRAYELFALLAAALVFAVYSAAIAPTPWPLVRLAAVVAAGSLTHYFFLFTVAAAAAWLWFDPDARASRRRTLAAAAVGLIPFALWSPFFWTQLRARRYSWIGGFDWREVVETPLRLFTPYGSGAVLAAGATVALVLSAWGAAQLWRRGPFGRLCVWLGAAPLIFAAAVWETGIRVYAVRNMIGVGPFLAVAAAAGIAALPRRAKALVPVVILSLVVGSFAWSQRLHGPAFDRIAHALVAEGWQAGDAVVVYGRRTEFRAPLAWYLPGHPTLVSTGVRRLRSPVFVVGGSRVLGARKLHAGSRRVSNMIVARLGAVNDLDAGQGASVFISARASNRSAAERP